MQIIQISKFTKTNTREKQIFQLVGIYAPYYNLLFKKQRNYNPFQKIEVHRGTS